MQDVRDLGVVDVVPLDLLLEVLGSNGGGWGKSACTTYCCHCFKTPAAP